MKRLKAVYIEPDGNLQVVSGRNEQGKSSVLDAIWLALGGGKAAADIKCAVLASLKCGKNQSVTRHGDGTQSKVTCHPNHERILS